METWYEEVQVPETTRPPFISAPPSVPPPRPGAPRKVWYPYQPMQRFVPEVDVESEAAYVAPHAPMMRPVYNVQPQQQGPAHYRHPNARHTQFVLPENADPRGHPRSRLVAERGAPQWEDSHIGYYGTSPRESPPTHWTRAPPQSAAPAITRKVQQPVSPETNRPRRAVWPKSSSPSKTNRPRKEASTKSSPSRTKPPAKAKSLANKRLPIRAKKSAKSPPSKTTTKEPHERFWDIMFQRLEDYQSKNGKGRLPSKLYEPDRALGQWVSAQGSSFRMGRLSKEQVAKLEEVGFVWDELDLQWKNILEQCKVNNLDKPDMDKQEVAAQDVGNQEECREEVGDKKGGLQDAGGLKRKTPDTMSHREPSPRVNHALRKKLVAELEANVHFLSSWDEMYGRLRAYKLEHGNCCVPADFEPDPTLGAWVECQRSHFRTGNLPQGLVAMLVSIGFSWEPTGAVNTRVNHKTAPKRRVTTTPAVNNEADATSWDEMYWNLTAYRLEKGNCQVPPDYESDPLLARWVASQQQQYKMGKLSQYCVSMLQEIGFEWSEPEEKRRINGTVSPSSASTQASVEWIDQESHMNSDFRKATKVLDAKTMDPPPLFYRDDEEKAWSENRHGRNYQRTYYRSMPSQVSTTPSPGVPDIYGNQGPLMSTDPRLQAGTRSKAVPVSYATHASPTPTAARLRFGTRRKAASISYAVPPSQIGQNDVQAPTHVAYSIKQDMQDWLAKQREAYRSGKLPGWRVSLLTEIGFIFDSPFPSWSTETHTGEYHPAGPVTTDTSARVQAQIWDEMFFKLCERVSQGEDCSDPLEHEDPLLAAWISEQRNLYKEGELSESRVTMLKSIGFVWEDNGAFDSTCGRKETTGDYMEDMYQDALDWYEMFERVKQCVQDQQ